MPEEEAGTSTEPTDATLVDPATGEVIDFPKVEGFDSPELPVVQNPKALDEMDFAEFKAFMREREIEPEDFQAGQWELIKDKDKLLDVPFIIAGAQFYEGSKGPRGFVSVRAFKEDGTKIVFVDGGTGIRDQIESFITKNGPTALIGKMCRNGLRKSDYFYVDGDPTTAATTYYLA